MAKVNLIPQFKGVKIKPWMRHLNYIFVGVLIFVGLVPLFLFGFLNYTRFMKIDYGLYGSVLAYLVLVIALGFYLQWFLFESTVLFAKLERLKRLSRFMFENNILYEKKNQNGKRKVKFPKVFLKQGKFELEASFELAGSKFQEKFKKIGGDLETTFGMDFMETEDDARFKTYKLAYSAMLNRIKISEMTFKYGEGVRLMKNFYWDFESDPHLLVVGGTGGGKTVFLRGLLRCLAQFAVVEIGDPKRADFVTLADLPVFKNRIFFEKEDIVQMFKDAVEVMDKRYDFMRISMKENGEKDLRPFHAYGLKPYFIICDEYNAFINSLGYKDREEVEKALVSLTLKGRQAGVNMVVAMQKPATEDIPSKVRDNMNMRISVGRLSDTGYPMVFGDANANKEFKYMKYIGGVRVYGRGYSAVFGQVAREFFAPLLEKKYSFYDEFSKLEYIPNPFKGREVQLTTEEIVKVEEKQTVVESVPTESVVLTLKEYADEKGYEPRNLRKIITILQTDYGKEIPKSGGQIMVDTDLSILLSEVMSEFEGGEPTYKKAVGKVLGSGSGE